VQLPDAKQELQPDSDGSRQSVCPAKPAAFNWLTQSHTVVVLPNPGVHVPSPAVHCSQPRVQYTASVCALHAVSAA
jgi:hypothetical protein